MAYKLTQQIIDSTTHAGDKPMKMADGGGLYLWVTPAGKYWRYNYRLPIAQSNNKGSRQYKYKTLALGVYPTVSINDARNNHQHAREQLRAGIDPGAVRREEKREKKVLMQSSQLMNKQLGQNSVSIAEADYLHELESQGIGYYYSHTNEPYIKGIFMTANDLIVFREDPVLFLATHHGVNRSIYLAWMNANHNVRCSALTKRGQRCQHIVKHSVDAKTFELMQHARCIQH